jgi:hypothetical protein
MLHDQIKPDIDPDLEQAREDLLPAAARIRQLSKDLVNESAGTRRRAAIEGDIRRAMEPVILRANRIAMSPDTLMMVLNAELDAKARGNRSEPSRATVRTAQNQYEQALIRLQEAREQAQAWSKKVDEETTAVAAAADAVRIFKSAGAIR